MYIYIFLNGMDKPKSFAYLMEKSVYLLSVLKIFWLSYDVFLTRQVCNNLNLFFSSSHQADPCTLLSYYTNGTIYKFFIYQYDSKIFPYFFIFQDQPPNDISEYKECQRMKKNIIHVSKVSIYSGAPGIPVQRCSYRSSHQKCSM